MGAGVQLDRHTGEGGGAEDIDADGEWFVQGQGKSSVLDSQQCLACLTANSVVHGRHTKQPATWPVAGEAVQSAASSHQQL
jgi:hypothetical protein